VVALLALVPWCEDELTVRPQPAVPPRLPASLARHRPLVGRL